MSSTFDTMQHALGFLQERVGDDDGQANDVIHYLQEIVSRLHDYSHRNADILNRGRVTGRAADLLRIALRYADDAERAEWLEMRAKM